MVSLSRRSFIAAAGAAPLAALASRLPVFAAELGDDLCPAAQATHTAVVTGKIARWDDPATWDKREVPPRGARVYVPCNTFVQNHIVTADLQWIRCEGVLTCCDHCDTQINLHTLYVPMHGAVMLGDPSMPLKGRTTLEFVSGAAVGLQGPFLPGDWQKLSLGVVCHGMFSAHGAGDKTDWLRVDQPAEIGATSITLRDQPLNWAVGDQILIAGTDSVGTKYQSEFRTLTAVAGRVLSFADPLRYRHFTWRSDLPYHVANLTRNVVIRSRDTSAIENRGHLMFMSPDNDIRYTKIEGLGRTDKSRPVTDPRKDSSGNVIAGSADNPRARYADHNHRVGQLAKPSIRRFNVVDGSPGWGMVNHASNCQWDNCIVIRTNGAAFVTEEGQENGWMNNCLAALNTGEGDTVHSTDDDHGREDIGDWGTDGSGFWLQGGLVSVSGCVSFDNAGRGFAIFNQPLNGYPYFNGDPPTVPWIQFPIEIDQSRLQPEYFQSEWWKYKVSAGQTPKGITSAEVPLRSFSGNTAYGNRIGLQSWNHLQTPMLESRVAWGAGVRGNIKDFATWGRGALCHLEYTTRMNVDGLKVVGDLLFRDVFNSITKDSPSLFLSRNYIVVTRYDCAGMVLRDGKPYVDIGSADDQKTHSVEVLK